MIPTFAYHQSIKNPPRVSVKPNWARRIWNEAACTHAIPFKMHPPFYLDGKLHSKKEDSSSRLTPTDVGELEQQKIWAKTVASQAITHTAPRGVFGRQQIPKCHLTDCCGKSFYALRQNEHLGALKSSLKEKRRPATLIAAVAVRGCGRRHASAKQCARLIGSRA